MLYYFVPDGVEVLDILLQTLHIYVSFACSTTTLKLPFDEGAIDLLKRLLYSKPYALGRILVHEVASNLLDASPERRDLTEKQYHRIVVGQSNSVHINGFARRVHLGLYGFKGRRDRLHATVYALILLFHRFYIIDLIEQLVLVLHHDVAQVRVNCLKIDGKHL